MKEGNELHGVDQGLHIFSSELYWLTSLVITTTADNGADSAAFQTMW